MEWICTNCKNVFTGPDDRVQCYYCKAPLEKFDLASHGRSLIGLSNAWIKVYRKWHDHPLMEEVSQEMFEDGVYGASTIFNAFIERLLADTYSKKGAENV